MKIIACYLIITFCFILPVHPAHSQGTGNYERDSIDLTRIQRLTIHLENEYGTSSALDLPFKDVRVEDVRFDTTYIGIYSKLTTGFVTPVIDNYKINLDGGLAHSFKNYLEGVFKNPQSGQENEVVCFIKSLTVVRRDTLTETSSMYNKYGTMKFGVEVFLHSGSNYFAAFKIDTVLNSMVNIQKRQVGEDMVQNFLMPAVRLMARQISNTNWQSIAKRKAFTGDFVDTHYFTSRFNLPVLTEPWKKGVYRNFTEFKNNAPGIENFNLTKEKFKTILLSDSKGDLIPTTKMFGYCDGEKCWILMGNYPFPLVRTGNGFEFFLSANKRTKLLLALDMEKGSLD